MKIKTVFWYGNTMQINWAVKHLASVTIQVATDFREVMSVAQNENRQVFLIVDQPKMNQEKILQFLDIFEFSPQIKLIFFFDNHEVPTLNLIQEWHHRRMNLIHRYDLFALRGCLMGLVDSSTMFLRKQKRIRKFGVIQIKRYMEKKWRKVDLADISVSGMGIQSLGLANFLRPREQVLVRMQTHIGAFREIKAEVRWIDQETFGTRAGLQFV